jgi:hypothetical protein
VVALSRSFHRLPAHSIRALSQVVATGVSCRQHVAVTYPQKFVSSLLSRQTGKQQKEQTGAAYQGEWGSRENVLDTILNEASQTNPRTHTTPPPRGAAAAAPRGAGDMLLTF